MRYLAFFLFTACAFSQPISAGLKVGAPLTDAFNTLTSGGTQYSSLTHRFTIGPMVEVRLPFRLGIEFDALYTRLDYNSIQALAAANQLTAATANAFQFPLLGKYRFGHGLVRPYVEAGPSFRSINGIKQLVNLVTPSGTPISSSSTSSPAQLKNTLTAGVAFGGGVDLHALVIHVSPEIRFTHWGSENFTDNVTGLLHTNLNEANFLLGITF